MNTDDDDVKGDYIPSAIAISSLTAIEEKEEKDEGKIHIYFDFPPKLRGDKIFFRINYGDDQQAEEMSLPLILPKKSMPTSFKITTFSIINNSEYKSSTDQITIAYATREKRSCVILLYLSLI